MVHPFLPAFLRGSDGEALRALASEDHDWRQIIRDASAHGLVPLLYRWLRRSGPALRLPADLAERLEREAVRCAARSMILEDELRRVLQAMDERGLSCAAVRGLSLAERLYGDVTARPTGDIDLLVRAQELGEVARTLQRLGFQELEHRAGFARAFSYTSVFLKERHGWLIVEPHWTLAYPPFADRIDMEGVWARCARGRVVGVETWLLGREDLLLHLCLHLAHHAGAAPLLWFYDLDRLVRREALDWPRFLSIARPAALGFQVRRALGTARAQFGSPIPGGILERLAPAPHGSRERRLLPLLTGRTATAGGSELAVFLTLSGMRPRLRYLLGLLFPSPKFMRVRYALTRRRQLATAYPRRLYGLSWSGLKAVMLLLSASNLRPRDAG